MLLVQDIVADPNFISLGKQIAELGIVFTILVGIIVYLYVTGTRNEKKYETAIANTETAHVLELTQVKSDERERVAVMLKFYQDHNTELSIKNDTLQGYLRDNEKDIRKILTEVSQTLDKVITSHTSLSEHVVQGIGGLKQFMEERLDHNHKVLSNEVKQILLDKK